MYQSTEIESFYDHVGPNHDRVQKEMVKYANKNDFPIIGQETGWLIEFITKMKEPTRVFEFGSGFGYSAYWFLKNMSEGGEIILTDTDKSELSKAQEFFESAGIADQAAFINEDAVSVANCYNKKLDIVLIDHHITQYKPALDAIRDNLSNNSIILADNIMYGRANFDDLTRYLETGFDTNVDKETHSLARYITTLITDDNLYNMFLPIGKGVAFTVAKYQN